MYFSTELETIERNELEVLQLERLQQLVKRVYENVPFYQEKLSELGIKPDDIQSLSDLQRLPFTTKQDLRDQYPFGLFATSRENIVRLHASSGTTGNPTVVGYTKNDIENWKELMARSLTSYGATPSSVVQNAYGYGLFTGGLGVHYGAEHLGATVVPISGGNTKRQIKLMQDFGTEVLCCTPSYALFIAEVLEESGIPRESLNLKTGVFGAEPWSEKMRQEIEDRLQIDAFDIYGLSEIMGPGVAAECKEKDGLHIFEDHFIPEIIDPDTCEVLPYGAEGELVITTITKEGIPLLRYRTRDITRLTIDPCSCGRSHVKMKRVTGRSDDMLIIRGVNVFPSQVESVLLSIGDTEPHYLLVVNRVGTLDTLEILVEVSESMFSDKIKRLEQLERKIRQELDSILGIAAKIRLVEPKTIERSEGKAKRILDKRKI
ncbi:phenylacetate--CoA ligase family protein [Desulfuribacillus alkaliarsenatis]|uniref:Phenylacetate-coenzyme A ligase n=1 Tax=Desulfuribacillus alkaliarsenatis TaxID=766136 RepID=A0A1E5G504_9FIRM|nr:phenylacetate--CoA ligase [Desulfuribacillus alkaliarsenatis]OEF98243.1 phenylacetate--CoA ligase [Desulfuribacillus alkaliarsenatis]